MTNASKLRLQLQIYACLAVCLGSLVLYAFRGFSLMFLAMWLGSLVGLSASMYYTGNSTAADPAEKECWTRKDWAITAVLLLAFAPLYLLALGSVPVQIGTDEVYILNEIRVSLEQRANPLGISPWYFGHPSLIFLVSGWLCSLFGDLTLANLRAVNAIYGIAIVGLTYLYFRGGLLMSRRHAVGGTLIVATCHSLIAFNRMNLRMNTSLMIELAALYFLFSGLRKRSLSFSFLGGCLAALGFYSYVPGRATIIAWVASVMLMMVLLRHQQGIKQYAIRLSMCMLGFALTVAPIIISTFQNPAVAAPYLREQLLITQEGLKLQQARFDAPTPAAALQKNFVDGIMCWFTPMQDAWAVYFNLHEGFVDGVTSTLFAAGLVILLFRLKRARLRTEADILSVVGFASIAFILTFIVSQAPSYTRMLVTLPFIAYIAVMGAESFGSALGRFSKKDEQAGMALRDGIFNGLIGAIVIANLSIYGFYVYEGLKEGERLGNGIRYVEDRRKIPNYAFYVLTSEEEKYFNWRTAEETEHILNIFKGPNQTVEAVTPRWFYRAIAHDALLKHVPVAFMMTEGSWLKTESRLKILYPHLKLHKITPDGKYVCVEVAEGKIPDWMQDSPSWLTLMKEGESALESENYKKAEDCFFLAIQEAEQKHLGLQFMEASIHGLGSAMAGQGQFDRARTFLELAAQQRSEAYGSDDIHAAELMSEAAAIDKEERNVEHAIAKYERALEIKKKLVGEKNPEYATTMHDLADAHLAAGHVREAQELFDRAFQIREKTVGYYHPETATTLSGQARAMLADKKFSDATRLFGYSLFIRKGFLKYDSLLLAMSYKELGEAQLQEGKYGDAESTFKEALNIIDRQPGRQRYMPDVLRGLARAYEGLSKRSEAEESVKRAEEIQRALDKDSPKRSSPLRAS